MSNSKSVIRTQKRKKIQAVEHFGGECVICGYKKCVNSLGFHHIDESTKAQSPTYVILHWSWERAIKELEKCILVCSNCHGEIHEKANNVDLRNYVKPWIKKVCSVCNEPFDIKDENQLYCSPECRILGSRIVERPTKEQLNDMIINKITWRKMGKMFNVSDNAVRKWAKSYKLIE